MTLGEALLLGIVQGLTEFLPISSTAHIRIVPALLGAGDPGAGFTAVIQVGTLVAVLAYFWQDIVRLTAATLQGLATGKPLATPEARLAWMIVVGTIPIVICGVLFKDWIKGPLRSLYVMSTALIVLALVLTAAEGVVEWRKRTGRPLYEVEQLGWGTALFIGLAQAVALVPGSSRSGVTITAGLFAGLSRAAAARFSFLLSLPSVFAAGVYELYKERHELLASQAEVLNLIVATVAAGIVGYASIAFLLRFLRTRTMYVFVLYRLALGGLLLVLLWKGTVQP
jgi:undecaprenyl-diphosphatase